MKWCRCPKCNHKLFQYYEEREQNNLSINIKCSSCKEIVDLLIYKGEVYYERKS